MLQKTQGIYTSLSLSLSFFFSLSLSLYIYVYMYVCGRVYRGFVGKLGQPGFRVGVLAGEGNVREIAAFLIDRQRFAGVTIITLKSIITL